MSVDTTGIRYVVIGVGVNVHTQNFPEEIQGTATSIWIESGRRSDRAKIIAKILERFEENYETFAQIYSLADLMDSYNARLINRNKEVRVLEPGQEYNGYALGINEVGELQVRRADGGLENIYAGEVSVRGLFGYV